MRAQLSVVIPTLNAASRLPDCLMSLMEGIETALIRELVIADGGSTDATLEIAEEAGADVVSGPPSRGGQLQRGVAATQGLWVLVVHADSVLPRGWATVVSDHIAAGHAGYFRLGFDRGGLAAKLVSGWANRRAQWFGLPYGDQGILVSRADYDMAGGYPDIPLMEDVALARALSGRLTCLPATIISSAEKYERDGWMRRGMRNLSLLMRYLAGADPKDLAKKY